MVEDGAFSHKIDYVTIFKDMLNLEGLPKVTVIWMTGWILPIGGASAAKALRLQPAQQAFLVTKALPIFTELAPSVQYCQLSVPSVL